MEQKATFTQRMQNLAKSVSERSGEMVESARLNGEISRLEADIEDIQFELGQAYFEAHKDDGTCEFGAYIQKILDCEREIRLRNERLLANKGLMYCPNCDTVIGVDDEFCSKCGARLPQQAIPDAQRPCANCGHLLTQEQEFCPQCGLKQNRQ